MAGAGRRLVWRAAARARSLVPEAALPHVLAARSLLTGDAPVVARPGCERLLVIAAHPDDETVMCGGTAALLAADGADVTAVFVTDGEGTRGSGRSDVAAVRREEARRACTVLGVRPVAFLGLPDGGVAEQVGRLGRELRPVLEEARPDAVAVPWFADGHPDHAAVSRGLAAADPPDGLEVLAGEVWTPLDPNLVVDVTAVVDRKRQALRCHETAARAFDLEAILGLNRYRSVHGLAGRGYAEAFLSAPWRDYRRAMDA